MNIVTELTAANGLFVDCPSCHQSIALRKASLFDATRKLPPAAAAALEARREDLAAALQEVRDERTTLSMRTFRGSSSGRVGKRLEMVAASLPGLPVSARDCRALSDPIDYLAFEGAASGAISAVHFIEVKSEKARLSDLQPAIKAAVDRGAVSLKVADHRLCIE